MSGSSLTGLGAGLTVGVRLEQAMGLVEGGAVRLEDGGFLSFSASCFASWVDLILRKKVV